jgi:molybdate/tungstate transport system substrate-binding protein
VTSAPRPPVRSVVLAAAAILPLAAGCGPARDRVELLYAASLASFVEDDLVPRVGEELGLRVLAEPEGSVAAAHRIREGVRRPDLYVTADPATVSLLGAFDPGWSIVFARGELVLGYASSGRFATALDSARADGATWLAPLLRPGFRLGRTDPDLDPKGYRAVWLLEAAAAAAMPPEREGLLAHLSDVTSVFPEAGLAVRVEAGQLDAGVFYLAEALARGLRVVRLPPELGQGDPDLADVYARYRHRTADGHLLTGRPIVYALTVPANAARPEAALALAAWLLGPGGRSLLAEGGLPPVARLLGDPDRAPAALRDLVERADR